MPRLGASSMTYNQALKIIKKIPMTEYLQTVGSVESKQPYPQDLDFITLIDLNIMYLLLKLTFPKTWMTTRMGTKRLDFYPIINGKNIAINIWKATENTWPFFYFAYGYPRGFVIGMRRKAKRLGYKLNQYGLYKDGVRQDVNTLGEIFNFFNIPFRTPEEQYLKHLPKK